MNKAKLIFNPHAGKKKFFGLYKKSILAEVLRLLDKYEIEFDMFETEKAAHATELAKTAQKEGYKMVVTVGGDGTANEAANGLVASNIPLGIIPAGTVMNIPRMLSIPLDIEGAIKVLKKATVKKIDLGILMRINGQKLSDPYYFIEASGIGLEAHLHFGFKKLEKGDFSTVHTFLKNKLSFKPHNIEILADGKTHSVHANLVTIANGPLSGLAVEMAPDARLDDGYLTVVVFKHDKFRLIKYFLRLIFFKTIHKRELTVIKAKEITVRTKRKMFVHADASLFGETPVQYRIKSTCLKVICGDLRNPKSENTILK